MEDSQPNFTHWCHECSAQTAAQRSEGGAHGGLVCADCGGGFIETMETARAINHVHRALRRHERSSQQRRLHNHSAALRRLEAAVFEAEFGHVGIERVNSVELFNIPSEQEALGENVDSLDDEGEGRSMQLHYITDEDDVASDADMEVNVLELSDWDSLDEDDEDEWEEVEARNNGSLDHRDNVANGVSVGHESEVLHASSFLEGNPQNARIPRNILHRLRAIRRNLQSFNAEMGVENFSLDMYVGDPRDYVDARGFEELLQQFMDSDTTRRGPPPAAKSAIDGLPTVLVQRVDVENGSALCAICKDLIEVNEPAKQLPCLHLYHSECIFPWLSVRNSCPVCRHELPTDDPEYEEQRKYENTRQQHEHSSRDSSGVSHDAGGEELDREGNPEGESDATDANVLFAVTSKGEVGDNTEARDCSISNAYPRERSSLFNVIAGPLCSVIGLVVVSCVGNFLLGSSSQRHAGKNQVGRAIEMQSSRSSWWGSLFGQS